MTDPTGTTGSGVSGRIQRVVLVGLMGAGKTTVGRRLARELGWRFVDSDAEVEAASGLTIPEFFRERGEEAFRDLEQEVIRRVLAVDRVVVSAGGGWASTPDRLRGLPPGTRSVWLAVSGAEAARRVGDGGDRPLLRRVGDPARTLERLLERRTDAYAAADLRIETDGRTATRVVAEVLRALASAPVG